MTVMKGRPWKPGPLQVANSLSSEFPEQEVEREPEEELEELELAMTPPRQPDPEPPAAEDLAQDGPMEPTLQGGDCEPMAGPSLDWRDRYPLGASIDQPHCRHLVQVYLPSAQATVVEDPVGQVMFRVPAIHRRTGAYTILAAPARIGNVGLIFRDCPEYDPVPVNTPTMAGWMGAGSFASIVTPASWFHPL